MKTFLECIPCFLRQTLEAARMATNDETVHEQILREVLRSTAEIDMQQSPPAMARRIHRRLRQLIENPDPYRADKQKHNRLALNLYNEMKETIQTAANPLEMAVRLAIAGNIIDLGVTSVVSDDHIHKTIEQCLTAPFDHAVVEQLRQDAEAGEKILYLTDNAGEIVFDRLLIEQLPTEKITAAVKGSPIINDATMDDARAVGLTDIVPVIDNGADAPGTILDICSETFRSHFEQADFVIAKGQGNYETLSDVDKHFYFILKAKCPVIAIDIDCPVGQMVLINKPARTAESGQPEMKTLTE